MTSSVDGLVSGMQTSTMITQLMQVEAAPQDRLKSKVNDAQTVVASYQSVNSQIGGLNTAADNLGQLSTWRAIQATSSSSTVSATALVGTNGSAGTTTFDVAAVAKSQITSAKVPTTGNIMSGNTLTVTIGDGSTDANGNSINKTVTVNVTDQSAKGVAAAINAAGIGVKAAIVTTGGTSNILQLSGTKTGAKAAFTVDGLDQTTTALNTLQAAGDAKLQIGGGEDAGGYDVTSDTNTFTGLMPGVSIAVTKVETGVTINATSDTAGIAAKFQALVSAANNALTEIGNQTAYDPGSKVGQPLSGDFAVRTMSQKILSAVSQGLSYDDPTWTRPAGDTTSVAPKINFGSLSQFGIQLDQTGQLQFDQDKFLSAYQSDPSKIQQAGIALGDEFKSMATTMDTNIKSVITGRNNEIDDLNTQIGDWDLRLADKKAQLQKTYSDLEVSLGKLKDQSSWLSGQLASLS